MKSFHQILKTSIFVALLFQIFFISCSMAENSSEGVIDMNGVVSPTDPQEPNKATRLQMRQSTRSDGLISMNGVVSPPE